MRTGRIAALIGTLVFAHVFAPTNGFAQCSSGQTPLVDVLSRDDVAIVFGGTVGRRERAGPTETVTFRVERVWKGPVKEYTVIYRPFPVNGDARSLFESSDRYVVIAHGLSATERQVLELDTTEDTFGTDMCGDGSRPVSVAGADLATIGPGHAPIDWRLSRTPLVAPPLRTKYVPPVYPDAARTQRIAGTVILELSLDARGKVSDVRVLRSIPLLDQAAIDCVTKWEYLPALVNGTPFYGMPTTVTVTFSP